MKTNLLLLTILGAAEHQVVGGAPNHPAEDAGIIVHPVHPEPGHVIVLHLHPAHWAPGLLLEVQRYQVTSLLTGEAVQVLLVPVEVDQHLDWTGSS